MQPRIREDSESAADELFGYILEVALQTGA
jgi:hypothetical protein